ncbi:vanadium-dependent haloperoxidase [Actinokineospora inagensis]|uniref:vanadium-dependent haloperoxidase n=1 Tax=Actinokineospora inagensis TaxID=103730 RepID=UPI00047CB0EA|nr:vanadium-dependent haloperoxidase [Actinokineospora inagensis]
MRLRLVGLVGLVAGVLVVPQAQAQQRGNVVLEWYDVTKQVLAAEPAPTQITNNRSWAIAWLAAARVDHGGRDFSGRDFGRDFTDAAVATAVHDSLVQLAPTQVGALDQALTTTLDRVPRGSAKDRGKAEGAAQARRALAEREGDGLDPASVNAPFPVPTPAPGVWQPTPPAYGPAIQYGNRVARPYLLRRPNQFRPGPPPALDSERYRKDLAEVRDYGSATSTVRTPAQTEVASFWYQGSQPAFVDVLRVALAKSPSARLVAEFNVIAVDTQIATSDAKYAYQLWRPVTALRATGLPDWTPLHVTPSHPDYPSGHATYAGFAQEVLTALTGPALSEPFDLTSTTAPGVVFHYRAWSEITRDTVNARVWSGIHTRVADEVGVQVGRNVAGYDLTKFDSLLR